MIKDNMTLLLYYDETTTLIYNMINNSVLGKIDNDSSLIRYLLNIMELHNVRVNENDYLVLRKLDNVVTTLQRVIIEFYSGYDVKLKKLLNKGYEVNHINKDKLDNRLCNLELVSHLDNIKHRDNKQYTVVYSSNELLKLQHIVKINQQYKKDTIYLQKMNKYIIDSVIRKDSNKSIDKLFGCRYCDYLLFNNVKTLTKKNASIIRESNNRVTFTNVKKYTKKSAFSPTNIDRIISSYDRYIVHRTIINNIEVINKLISLKQNSNFKLLLEKIDFISIIKELKYNYLHTPNNYLIIEDNILLTLSIKDIFREIRSKNKKLLILYLLNIFKRLDSVKNNTNYFKYKQRPTTLIIPYLLKEDFINIDLISKDLLNYYKNITYSLLTRNTGNTSSQLIYRNSNLENKYKNRDIKTIEYIYTILSNNTDLQKYGYITIEDLITSLRVLNEERKNNGLSYNNILNGTEKFVRRHLNKDTQLINDLSKIGIKYISLNNKTISSILSYQKEKKTYSLYLNKKVIVLSKLYKK